jgi:hypothetical protein
MKLTPVLYVDAIEPCLRFWTGLGFAPALEVPEGDRLGFVILVRDDVEVMYQTRANLAHDLPELGTLPLGPAVLYLEVPDLDAVDLAGIEVLVPRRLASYGPSEIWVREPGGHVVGLAQTRDGTI